MLALGVGLRLHGLGVHSLWFDETASLAVATADDPLLMLRGDRHPPLFFLLLRGWRSVVGDADAALRLLPALLGIASLFGLHAVARRLLPRDAALLATALFAVAPYQVWWAQELRMYALLELGTVLALLGAVAPAGRLVVRCALLAGGAAIAFGSHYFGFLVPALCAPLVWGTRTAGDAHGGRRDLAVLLLAPVVGLLPWLPWLLRAVPDQMRAPWSFRPPDDVRELLELPVRLFVVFGSVMSAALPVAIGVLVAAGLVGSLVHAVRGDRVARVAGASVLLAAVALALVFTVLPPTLVPVYLMGVSPVAVLLVAHGLARGLPGGRWFGTALAVACLWGTLELRSGNHKDDYRAAVAELAQAFAPGDFVVAVTGTSEPFSQAGLRHYLRAHPAALAAVRDLPDLLDVLERGALPAARLQVLYRARPYAVATLRRLQACARQVHAGPVHEAMQHLTFELPP